ncbi:prephenate dehydrogenase [Candidatus Symbiobacter mobilis]|uniref:Prephenate dehydrogenase n=1 Tax=Candidatus Symbiobacter mobilis CR TaxID=946483 RepID=U5N674_9BURK|nr:prephenate dehydrogenase/arogenate dehydrogenase family protein [Candidatus Symbiobacter mobilis]AGX87016.1 prephenate dehydrogenase [Candidatus Symbiobacter mobilis CR]
MFEQLGLIGCGLMGGSFALALRRRGLVRRIVGYSPRRQSLERALAMGAIDIAASSPFDATSGADLVLIAVPVSATAATFAAIRDTLTPRTLLMDVGSTKCDVVDAALQTLGEHLESFVPAHPIAGKECAGIEHADAELYAGRQVILTPLEQGRTDLLQAAETLWTALGSTVVRTTPQEHDAAFAAVSHLPHLVAFAAMNAILGQTHAAEYLALAGPGFRDFTRIAASDPAVWRDILLANRANVLQQCEHLHSQLQAFTTAMRAGDAPALDSLLHRASTARARWTMTSS